MTMRCLALAAMTPLLLSAGPAIAAEPIGGAASGIIVIAQADLDEQIAAARAEVEAAEQALADAQANDGDVRAARRELQQARRRLAQLLAQAGETRPEREQAEEEQPEAEPDTEQAEEQPEETEPETEQAEEQQEEAEPETEQAEDVDRPRRRRDREQAAEEQEEAEPETEQAEDSDRPRRRRDRGEQEVTEDEPEEETEEAAEAEDTGIEGERVDRRTRELRRKLRAERRRERAEEREQAEAEGGEVIRGRDRDRTIIRTRDGRIIIRSDSESDRLLRGARDVEVEELRGGRTRTTVTRPNGVQVITVRNRRGDIIYRVRRMRNGREVVLIDNRRRDEDRRPRFDVHIELPPIGLDIPRDEYIVDLDEDYEEEDIQRALAAPPVIQLERHYTLDEVRYNEDVRDLVRRIDLDAITFETDSARITRDQIRTLSRLGRAIESVIADNPDALLLVEGHTDAVGSEFYNLELSDRRAESVAIALSENFDIPPENLITQGYGEEYLKIPTLEAERRNRRVTVRNITNLLTSEAR